MLSLQQFIAKYNGKGIDYDGSYGNQCVDLMNQFLVEVDGIASPIQVFPGDTAYNIYLNANDARFTKITNTPTGVPQAGDIMFWNTSIGFAGHVAVFISGDQNNFTSFDENWPVGSLCHEQGHDYNGVAGWLHLKAATTQPVPSQPTSNDGAKATRFDQIVNILAASKFLPTNHSEDYITNDKVQQAVTWLITDRVAQSQRAGAYDAVVHNLFGTSADSTKISGDQVIAEIKARTTTNFKPQLQAIKDIITKAGI